MSIPRHQNPPPTWRTGFARFQGKALYPHWRHGLVGLWAPVLGPAQGLVVRDLSGFKRDGTLENMAADDWIIDGSLGGYALDFDGTSDRMKITTPAFFPDLFGNKSYTVVIHFNTADQNVGRLWGISATTPDGFHGCVYDAGSDPNKAIFYVSATSNAVALKSVSDINDGLPHLMHFWADGTNQKIFLDGLEDATQAIQAPNSDNGDDLYFGTTHGAATSTQHFLGQMNYFAVYDRPLNPVLIAEQGRDVFGILRKKRQRFIHIGETAVVSSIAVLRRRREGA